MQNYRLGLMAIDRRRRCKSPSMSWCKCFLRYSNYPLEL